MLPPAVKSWKEAPQNFVSNQQKYDATAVDKKDDKKEVRNAALPMALGAASIMGVASMALIFFRTFRATTEHNSYVRMMRAVPEAFEDIE